MSGAVNTAVEFGGPEGKVVGGVELGVEEFEFFHALVVGQARPGGFFLAEIAGENFIVVLGIDRVGV
jgi:hypothetical protein